jgi:SAM-dependent methyltransferase
MLSNYYDEKLAAEKLKRCYEIAPARVKQYLNAEIEYVISKLYPDAYVLELGCGYGRVLARLAPHSRWAIGIDTSYASLMHCQSTMRTFSNYVLLHMDALHLAFCDRIFDVVVCVQNGISAFHVDQRRLIRESIRVTRSNGKILFSSYTDSFWSERLAWFRIQANAGLIGEIDIKRTKDGVIVSKDGFTARTIRPHEFNALVSELNVDLMVTEIDRSSVFYEITAK